MTMMMKDKIHLARQTLSSMKTKRYSINMDTDGIIATNASE